MSNQQQRFTFAEHYNELRLRLIVCLLCFVVFTVVSFVFASELSNFLTSPLADLFKESTYRVERKLIFTSLAEGFTTEFKIAWSFGLILTLPIIALQLYLFLKPGLYLNEKRIIAVYLLSALILLCIALLITYYFVMPVTWRFFISFEKVPDIGVPIVLEPKISEYLSLVIELALAFSFAFQLPIIISILALLGFVTTRQLVKGRRYAIVLIFALAAILTPPDVMSQIMLALPLMLLYELSILLSKFIKQNKKPL